MQNRRVRALALSSLLWAMACDDSSWNPQGGLQDLSLLHPLDGDTLSGETGIQFQASPWEGLARVEVLVDGEEVLGASATPFSLPLDVLPWADDSRHSLSLRAAAGDGIFVEAPAIEVWISADSQGPAAYTAFDRRLAEGTVIHALVPAPAGWLLGGERDGAAWLLRIDNRGEALWERVYGESGGRVLAIERSGDGSWLAAGALGGTPWLARLGADGNRIEERLYTEDAPGEVRRMLALPGGDRLLALSVLGAADQPDPVLRRVDGAGVSRWRMDPFSVDYGLVHELRLESDGRITTLLASRDSGDTRTLLARIEESGALVWMEDTGPGEALDLQADSGGYVLAGRLTDNGPALLRRVDAIGQPVDERVVSDEGLLEFRRLLPVGSSWQVLGTRIQDDADMVLARAGFESGLEAIVAHGGSGDQAGMRLLEPLSGGVLLAGEDRGRAWILRTASGL